MIKNTHKGLGIVFLGLHKKSRLVYPDDFVEIRTGDSIIMKNIVVISIVAILFGVSSVIYAGDAGFRGKRFATAGYSSATYDELSNSINGYGVGVNVPLTTRLDLALSSTLAKYQEDTFLGKIELDSNAIGANLIYHLSTTSIYTPYFGAGIGYVSSKVSFAGISQRSTDTAFRGLAGLQIEPSSKAVMDLTYGLVNVDNDSTSTIAYAFSYWVTDVFAPSLGLAYDLTDEGLQIGISGNFFF